MPFPPSRATRRIAFLLFGVCVLPVHAAGLGSIQVNSSLGQPLSLTIPLVGNDTLDHGSHCIKAKVSSLDGAFVLTPGIALMRSAQSGLIKLSTRQSINEPALNVFVDMGCDTPVRREYQILLDLPLDSPMPPPVPAALSAPSRRAEQARAPQSDANRPPRMATVATASGAMRTADRLEAPPADTVNKAAARTKPKQVAKAAEKKAERSVLRMSAPDFEPEDPGRTASLKLKFADTLSLAVEETDPQKLARLYAEQERLGALLRNEDLVETTREQLKKVQAELGTLRAETERLRQQNRIGQEELHTARAESTLWISVLGGGLALLAIALCLLLWRMQRMTHPSSSWKKVANDYGTADDDDTLDGATEFSITEFNTAEFGADFNTTEFDPSAFDIDESDAAMPGQPMAPATASPPQPLPPVQHKQPARRRADKTALPESAASDRPAYTTTSMTPFVFLHRAEKAQPAPDPALKAMEISDVMELAEAWMALQDTAKVKDLLEPFSEVERPDSPLPWLCLLDVYRAMGDREKYDAILQRIARIFNVNLSPWDVDAHAEAPKILPDYPHVVQKILELWPTDDLLPYLKSLLEDDRDGSRKGFDLPVYRDILRLTSLASNPDRPRRREQIMHDSAYAILFAAPRPQPDSRPAPEDAGSTPKQAAEHGTQAKPLMRVRPKYITPSYERGVVKADETTPAPAKPRERKSRTAKPVPASSRAEELALVETAPETPPSAADENRRLAQAVSTTLATGATIVTNATIESELPDAIATPPTAGDDMSPMSIKLHLAIAYQDIGDTEGACLLLEEVVNDGSPEQSEQAQKMLDRLI